MEPAVVVPRIRLATEARQAVIVQTVLQLAAGRSPGDITTADIAAAMGLTQGAVFRHFPNKEAIWLAVAGWLAETLLAAIETAAAADAEPLAGLQEIFRAHVRFVMAHPGVPRFIFHELQQPGESPVKARIQAMLQAYRGLVVRLLKAAKRARRIPSGLDEAAATALFIGAIQGLVMQSMLAGNVKEISRLAEGVLAVYLSALAGGTS